MAIQLYECPNCGLQVERIERANEEPEPPVCSEGLREDEECGDPFDSGVYVFDKKIGRPNAHFKGTGFHQTDYSDSSNPASNT